MGGRADQKEVQRSETGVHEVQVPSYPSSRAYLVDDQGYLARWLFIIDAYPKVGNSTRSVNQAFDIACVGAKRRCSNSSLA